MKNRKTPGQIAVIITLFIAVIILLSVVIINIGKVSDAKVSTSQVSDRGALGLCSQLSTYVNVLQKQCVKNWVIGPFTLPISSGTCSPNWNFILPALGVISGIALLVFTAGASSYLVSTSLFFGMLAIGNIQSQGFSAAVYNMTEYTAYRESAVMSMLTAIQSDGTKVKQTAPGATTFIDDSVNPSVTYDLKDTPGLLFMQEAAKKNNPVYRFNAWYWGVRYKAVTEIALAPIINQFIEDVNQNIIIDKWNPDKFLVEETSFKLKDFCGNTITSTNPDWVYDSSAIRVMGPVKHIDDTDVTGLAIDAIWGLLTGSKGFLPVRFKDLTERLLDAGYEQITYSKTTLEVPLLGGILYDHREIGEVTDILKGFLIRYTELLNIPVSYRITAVNSWLPPLYNHNGDHTLDMYGKLGIAKEKVSGWITQLEAVDEQLKEDIPPGAGHDSWAKGEIEGNDCATVPCCGWDCETLCCDPTTCTKKGIYCSACGGGKPPTCTAGDLYTGKPAWCGTFVWFDPGCACSCPQSPECPDFCKFQGQLNDANPNKPTEVRQAIVVLQKLNDTIDDICEKLEALNTQVETVINPTDPEIQKLKNEAAYGWIDKNNVYHMVKVVIYGYPPRTGPEPQGFPYVGEREEILTGLIKCWEVKGRTSGPITTKVYRYDSDVPTGWWDLKVRRNPGAAQFDKDKLKAIINEIHTSAGGKVVANNAALDDLTANYAIASATLGHYGPEKNKTYIEKAVP